MFQEEEVEIDQQELKVLIVQATREAVKQIVREHVDDVLRESIRLAIRYNLLKTKTPGR